MTGCALMPSLLTIEQAVPLCWKRRVEKKAPQQGWHRTCFAPIVYTAATNTWDCPRCGARESGMAVVARASVVETHAA
jgi:hypothetical protein